MTQDECENCGASPAKMCGAATLYHWDGEGEDPNRDLLLCTQCAEEYYAYWEERWDEYYRGLL